MAKDPDVAFVCGMIVQKEAVFPITKQPQYTEPLLKTYLADLAKAGLPKN